MKLDVDSSVAVHAINLCSILLQLDLLDGEEANDICELVFMENRAISHAAGQFLCQHLLSDEFLEKAKTMQINPGICMCVSMFSVSVCVLVFGVRIVDCLIWPCILMA